MKNILKDTIESVYGNDPGDIEYQVSRYDRLQTIFQQLYSIPQYHILSAPGRTELSGNHTDHNRGRVLAASINLDTIGIASKSDSNKAIVYSDEYQKYFEIHINDLTRREVERHTTGALIRGIIRGFQDRGYQTGGFAALVQSDVTIGSGLSSSASIEILIGSILNVLYNNGTVDVIEIAKIGQYAENEYFGKPCGLMDQIACAVGGVVEIDFQDPDRPIIEEVRLALDTYKYRMVIIDTGSNHADLTADYAAVRQEMISVANVFGKNYLRDVTKGEIIDSVPKLRQRLGERAILRALHYFDENERVKQQIECLKQNQFDEFLKLVNESGRSSLQLLQNIYSSQNPKEQPVTLAISLTENFLNKIGEGAVRIHGGGFAGTIQVFLPVRYIREYQRSIEKIFGAGCARTLDIRKHGIVKLL
jgi:galactokinase